MTDEKSQRHQARMKQRKEIVDANIARATEDRGVVIVLTGDGKGRTPGSPPVNLEEGHYRILVRITDTQLHRHGMDMRASPGMSALVEIKTGQKTVLEYLLRPVQALTQALRER